MRAHGFNLYTDSGRIVGLYRRPSAGSHKRYNVAAIVCFFSLQYRGCGLPAPAAHLWHRVMHDRQRPKPCSPRCRVIAKRTCGRERIPPKAFGRSQLRVAAFFCACPNPETRRYRSVPAPMRGQSSAPRFSSESHLRQTIITSGRCTRAAPTTTLEVPWHLSALSLCVPV